MHYASELETAYRQKYFFLGIEELWAETNI